MNGAQRTACLERGAQITDNTTSMYPHGQGLNIRWRTRRGITDRRTDNMQFLVWPVHRTFARQQYHEM